MSTEPQTSRESDRNRQIVGFSLSPDMAREVKTEAARRNINLKKLFEELWDLYKKSSKSKQPHGS